MPDVFSGNWAKALANVLPSGASKLLVKLTGDSAYYDLGAPRDVDIQFESIGKPDSLRRQQSWGTKIKIKVPTLQASVTEIKALASLVAPTKQPVSWAITELDNKFLKDAGAVSAMYFVLKMGGKLDDYRIIEYYIEGNIATSEQDAIFSNTGVTIGTPATSDALYTLAQTKVGANRKPNGITKVEFKASGDASYADFGDFNDNKCDVRCLFEPGGGGRQLPRVHGFELDFECMGLQTSLTEKQLLDSIISNEIDLKLTFQDGMIWTLPNQNIGVHPVYKNVGNADKVRTVNLIGGGAIVNWSGSAFETAEDTPTAWASMFS